MSATIETRLLGVEDATAANIAPFGSLVGVPRGRAGRGTQFYGDTVELWHVAGYRSDEDACLSVARVQPRPGRVQWMERHFRHTQAFLPLNARPFVVVMAPPNASHAPDADAVRALRIPAGQGLLLHVGTWHEFPFPVDEPLDVVVVLRNETNRDLEVVADGEAVGGDLEKRNIERRLGVRFELPA